MDDAEVIAALKSNSLVASVRREIVQRMAQLEQRCQQRQPPRAIDIRRAELELAEDIVAMVQNEPPTA